MIFCRQNDFKFFGRCIVQMDNSTHAGKLAEYGHMRLVGGSHIKMKLVRMEAIGSQFLDAHRAVFVIAHVL